MRAFIVLIVAVVLAGGTGVAWAAPGDLDTSFGGGTGKAIADLGGTEFGHAMALQPDGKIVVAGSTDALHAMADFAVAVFTNPGGVLDRSYGPGGGGRSIGDLGAGDVADALALQPDGKIVTAGSRSISSAGDSHKQDLAVVRFTYPGGLADPTFGGGSGVGIGDLGGNIESGRGVAVRPDGKIIVAGSSNAADAAGQDFAVASFTNPGGALDPFYGGGTGRSLGDLGGVDTGRAVVLQPDGKIVVAGERPRGPGQPNDLAVVRFTYPQGAADTSFGVGGSGVAIGNVGGDTRGNAVALQPNASDGKIVVAGSLNGNFVVARFTNPQGKLDPSFASNGSTTIDFGGNQDEATGVAVQPDGKIVVVGSTGNQAVKFDFAVARLQPDGVLDTTFGTDGKVTLDLGGANDFASSVALQADGKILVGGTSDARGTFDFAVARFQGDPPPAGGGGGGLGPPKTGGGGKVAGPPTCAGKKATIFGTTRGEKLTGTKKADVIVGLGGNDTIKGGGGNDLICGGDGNDRVDGGTGNDRIYGQAGKDSLSGGDGNDRVDGGTGNDRIHGQAGKDALSGAGGSDHLDGGTGNDRLAGQSGNDALLGGSGNDHLDGGTGNDRLAGQSGNDALLGGSGNDHLDGGTGNDHLSGQSGKDRLTGGPGRDVLNGGTGKDTQHQ